ncbi:MAG: hypothetical protein MK193_10035 [Lentisphaeria bacterium]|nr:hypothetical protein [Lentisphaeria bacterium]
MTQTRGKARAVTYLSQLKQVGTATQMYTDNNQKDQPPLSCENSNGTRWYQKDFLGLYWSLDYERITKKIPLKYLQKFRLLIVPKSLP